MHSQLFAWRNEPCSQEFIQAALTIQAPWFWAIHCASRELIDAVLVNPYDREQFSEGIYAALSLSEEERRKCMVKMREVVRTNNIFRWPAKWSRIA